MNIIVISPSELESLIQSAVHKVFSEQIALGQTAGVVEEDPLMFIKEASTFLNLAPQTIYGFTSQRQIPFIKRGKKLYFRKSELITWLNEGRRKTITEIKADLEAR